MMMVDFKMFGVLWFTCLVVSSVTCVTNYRDNVIDSDKAIITHDERRAADSTSLGTLNQELRSTQTYPRSRFYIPSDYEASATGGGPTSFGSNPNAYLPPYYNPPTGSGNQGFASSHGYGFYPDTGYNSVRGPTGHGTTSPQSGYGSFGLKGLLIPLAGIALLGAAAALSTNPVLLQLGVLNGRRKRSLPQIAYKPVHSNLRKTSQKT